MGSLSNNSFGVPHKKKVKLRVDLPNANLSTCAELNLIPKHQNRIKECMVVQILKWPFVNLSNAETDRYHTLDIEMVGASHKPLRVFVDVCPCFGIHNILNFKDNIAGTSASQTFS